MLSNRRKRSDRRGSILWRRRTSSGSEATLCSGQAGSATLTRLATFPLCPCPEGVRSSDHLLAEFSGAPSRHRRGSLGPGRTRGFRRPSGRYRLKAHLMWVHSHVAP
jgi:hypothetical protein